MSLEAVHACTVNPLLGPPLKYVPLSNEPPFLGEESYKAPPPSPILLNDRLYLLITIVTLHADSSGMVYSPSRISDLLLQWNFYPGDTHGTKETIIFAK